MSEKPSEKSNRIKDFMEKWEPVLLGVFVIIMIIAVAVTAFQNIYLAMTFNAVLMAGLIGVTVMHVYSSWKTAVATKQQADASVEIAEATKEQRYDMVRPVIDIQRQAEGEELLGEGFAAKKEDFSHGLWCILRNIGVGPATDVYSFFINPLYNKRQQWDFGTLAIGAATPKVKLSIEQRGDRRVLLVVYYKDVHGRCFESSREVSVDKERNAWNTGPLKTEVRKIAKGDKTNDS